MTAPVDTKGRTAATRGRLIASAEVLFAAEGVEGVSMREINREAGQANVSALQYHFGDKSGLLMAVIEKHAPGIDLRRHALLDQYESEGEDDLRTLASALVLPLAAKLGDADGGREYLRITAELINRPDPVIDDASISDPADSIYRWRKLVEPMLPPEATQIFHTRFAAIRFAHIELGRRAAERRRPDDSLFVSRLVDLVAAVLATSVSDQTRRLIRKSGRAETGGRR